MRTTNRRMLVCLIAFFAAAKPLGAVTTEPGSREDRLKAAFVYNFTKFVEWPAGERVDAPLMVCTVGGDPMVGVYEAMTGRTVRGRLLAYRHLEQTAEADACDVVVFLTPAAHQEIRTFTGSAVLTVGNGDAFTEHGGIIRLFFWKNQLRFEVNLDAAERAGLSVDSELLALADNVRSQRYGRSR